MSNFLRVLLVFIVIGPVFLVATKIPLLKALVILTSGFYTSIIIILSYKKDLTYVKVARIFMAMCIELLIYMMISLCLIENEKDK